MPTDTDADDLALLTDGELLVEGQLVESSNGAILATVTDGHRRSRAIYKPIAWERPLWDYPDGTLAQREHAAYLIDRHAGFDLVPPTVLRQGPFGLGSVQLWVAAGKAESELVAVTAPREVPAGWVVVLRAQDESGAPLVLAHADTPALRSMAVLDAVLNNSDRKGGHIIATPGALHAVDHGVSLGAEPKLRTVLWGWAGQPIPATDLERLRSLAAALDGELGSLLTTCLTAAEITALRERVATLLRDGRHFAPRAGWPPIPWPAL